MAVILGISGLGFGVKMHTFLPSLPPAVNSTPSWRERQREKERERERMLNRQAKDVYDPSVISFL